MTGEDIGDIKVFVGAVVLGRLVEIRPGDMQTEGGRDQLVLDALDLGKRFAERIEQEMREAPDAAP